MRVYVLGSEPWWHGACAPLATEPPPPHPVRTHPRLPTRPTSCNQHRSDFGLRAAVDIPLLALHTVVPRRLTLGSDTADRDPFLGPLLQRLRADPDVGTDACARARVCVCVCVCVEA
jgi:hypothetical protein